MSDTTTAISSSLSPATIKMILSCTASAIAGASIALAVSYHTSPRCEGKKQQQQGDDESKASSEPIPSLKQAAGMSMPDSTTMAAMLTRFQLTRIDDKSGASALKDLLISQPNLTMKDVADQARLLKYFEKHFFNQQRDGEATFTALDMGCGVGTRSFALSEFPFASVTGLDFSTDFIAAAKKTQEASVSTVAGNKNKGDTPDLFAVFPKARPQCCTFVEGDALDPFPALTKATSTNGLPRYDAILCFNVLCCIGMKGRELLSSLDTCLSAKPGSLLVLTAPEWWWSSTQGELTFLDSDPKMPSSSDVGDDSNAAINGEKMKFFLSNCQAFRADQGTTTVGGLELLYEGPEAAAWPMFIGPETKRANWFNIGLIRCTVWRRL